jgi:hypothetical protein
MNTNRKFVYIGGNGYVYALLTRSGEVAWETELKPGWFKTGNNFVSLMEDGQYLYAFSYGTFYKLKKSTGEIVAKGNEIKNLKNKAGVFSVDPDASTGGAVAIGSDGGDGSGDGGGGGDGDGGGGGD